MTKENRQDPEGPEWTAAEFRSVGDRLLDWVSRHPKAGPVIRELGLSGRIELTDLGLVLTVRLADARRLRQGHHLVWRWGTAAKTAVSLRIALTSQLANRCTQGKEVIPLLVATGRIAVETLERPADRDKALDALPLLMPLQKEWGALLRREGHLKFVL